MQILRTFFVRALALCLATSVAFAQQPMPSPGARQDDRPQFRQEELDQMLAPIALYPDALLSQVLMAATYPLEVVQASRWSRANPGLKGEQAVRAVEDRDWDPSVKSLVAFPQILTMMDERLDWTERLGDAFLGQQADVMDSVQHLRDKAYVAGNLRSNEQQRVTRQAQTIVIEPPSPQVVYVPYYNPYLVYGGWWWPAYPPVYWPAPVVYYPRPAFVSGFIWGVGVSIGAGFFYGGCDWPRRQVVNVVNVNNYYYTKNAYVNRTAATGRPLPHGQAAPVNWEHNPAHRRGVPYRDPAVRQAVLRDDNRRFDGRDDHRDDRRDARPQDRAQANNPGNRSEGRPDPRNGRESESRADGNARRPDWREVQRDNMRAPSDGRRTDSRPAAAAPASVAQPGVTERESRGDNRAEGRGAFIPSTPAATPAREPRADARPEGRERDARDPAQGRGDYRGGDAQRAESRGERGGREAVGRRDPAAPSSEAPGAPAPVVRAPDNRGAQPRMEARPEARVDSSPGERRGESRGDNGGGRGRDQRSEVRHFEAPTLAQPTAPTPRPQMAESRAPAPQQAPTPAPQARMQAPPQPAAPPSAPRAAPSPSASAPAQQGGNANGGGRGGGGMMHGGGPPMR
jgi:hypothetical protein